MLYSLRTMLPAAVPIRDSPECAGPSRGTGRSAPETHIRHSVFQLFAKRLNESGGRERVDDKGLPCVSIDDAPNYEYRGFSLDCARHFWTVEKIKQFIDVMAHLKMNEFHWHLTDDQGWRAEIKKYPLLIEKATARKRTPLSPKAFMGSGDWGYDENEYGRGLYYSQDDMREVVAYAKERFVEVVPEIDMPGHMVAAIACYPNLSCTGEPAQVYDKWGVTDNICCCGKDDVYNFAKDIIDELCEIFDGRFFHIGGDEVPKTRWKNVRCVSKR